MQEARRGQQKRAEPWTPPGGMMGGATSNREGVLNQLPHSAISAGSRQLACAHAIRCAGHASCRPDGHSTTASAGRAPTAPAPGFSSAAAVGATGVPVSEGEASGAYVEAAVEVANKTIEIMPVLASILGGQRLSLKQCTIIM